MTDWVRLWHDMPTDPKWRTIARKSGQRVGDVIAVFNFMMVSASANASERGTIGDGFDFEDIGTALDLDDADIQAIFQAMQGKVLDGMKLCGWEKRQPKREDSSAERAKAWREERKRTQANAEERPETDTESEEETEKKKERAPDGAYAFVGNVIRLKPDQFDRWRRSFPDLDLTARLQQRDDWLANDADDRTKKKWFIPTSNWLAKLQQEAATARAPPVWDGMP
jgi:predicted  nucleic acid-binding Zn-ribbon protein